MPDDLIGASLRRVEDFDLLTGGASFVDDLQLDGVVHAAFVRSAYAHARIDAIDVSAARAAPGVIAVYTIDDLGDVVSQDRVPENFPKPPPRDEIGPWILARDEVCYVGEAVAIVIAESRYLAEDAVQMVTVDYTPLPALGDPRDSAAVGAAFVNQRAGKNVFGSYSIAHGAVDPAFAAAPHVVSASLRQHRGCSLPMECRGSVVRFDPRRKRLTMWSSTQAPHSDKSILVCLLGLAESDVRVIVPSVGGGFGPKLLFYPEDAAIAAASVKLGLPVKWIEDRRENLLCTTQEREQFWEVEMAADQDGHILGLRGKLFHDQGAYTARGANIPYSSATTILGPYIVPTYRMDVVIAHTNKVPATSMRGAGHPQGSFTMERLLDRVAAATGIDRAEIRSRNMIAPEAMPYEQPLKTQAGQKIIYDSGNYAKCQADLLAAIDYDGFPARQRAARAEGRFLGIGIANYVKPTGRGPFETGLVRIGTSGKVMAYTGGVAMGQGFHTAMSQIVAQQLGIRPEDVTVTAGDTDGVPMGIGGFASRLTVCAGSSVHLASVKLREKIFAIAAHMLEASAEDLELIDGKVFIKGVPGIEISFSQIAHAVAGTPGYALPEGMTPGLEAEASFQPENVTYANGAHAAEVEIDPDTGGIRILRYVVVHDSGRMINPMIVDGQVHGGVTNGLGNALFEQMVYDEDVQPLSTNLAEYLAPSAPDVPRYEIIHQVSPTDRNPIGVKGVGECGVMSAAPSILSAIEDALGEFDVTLDSYPVTPMMLIEKIHKH